MDARVAEAMLTAKDKDAAGMMSTAAKSVARIINSKPSEIFFTTGVTLSIHTAIENIFNTYKNKGTHIITTKIEHAEVLKAIEALKDKGADVTLLGVNKEGLVDVAELESAIQPTTIMVSVMAANNHTGVIQPLEQISAVCKTHDVVLFSDASQFVGKMRCDVTELGIDCMAFGSHKMHGPKEIGALFIKENTPLHAYMREQDVAQPLLSAELLAGFAKAAELFNDEYWDNSAHISKIKNYFEHQLLDLEDFRINGSTRYRLYNTSNVTFSPATKIQQLEDRFKFLGYYNNDGYVLTAMGVSDPDVKNSFRFSFGKYNTLDEVKLLVEEINKL